MFYSTIAKHSIKFTTMDTSKINRVHLALYLSACPSTLIIFSTPILSLPDIKQKREKEREKERSEKTISKARFCIYMLKGYKTLLF